MLREIDPCNSCAHSTQTRHKKYGSQSRRVFFLSSAYFERYSAFRCPNPNEYHI